MKKRFSILLAAMTIALGAKAVIADPTPFAYTLENGEAVMAIMHGDEYHSYITDTDGNLLSGSILPTAEQNEARMMRRVQQMQQMGKDFPTTGSPRSVVILLDFPDMKFSKTKKDFERMLNEEGYSENGGTGSCRDYFIASSNGVFKPEFDVYGPYTVSHEYSYYGSNIGTKGDQRPDDAFIEASQLASEAGVDFSQYDLNNDGKVDNVFFYYAGHNEAEGGGASTIWPHQSTLLNNNVRVNGKLLDNYACTSELKGSAGSTMCAIGTFCHEFGHVLGLPDLYNTSNSTAYTVGSWSIMCSGNYNNNSHTPPTYSAYERMYLGWLQPIQLENPGSYQLRAIATENEAYLIAKGKHNLDGKSPSPTEFFLLENRQRTGWDSPAGAIVGTGMIVWHIDFSSSAWANNTPNNGTPLRVHLEEADGHKSSSQAADAYPGPTGKRTTFMPTLHSGEQLTEQSIFGIAQEGDIITFTYITQGETRLELSQTECDFLVHIDDNGKPTDWKPIKIEITGKDIDSTETISLSTDKSSRFFVTVNEAAVNQRTSTSWVHNTSIKNKPDSMGNLKATFYISYNPKEKNCTKITDIVTIKSKQETLSLRVSGEAPRPVLVKTPYMLPEKNIYPYSFDINWKDVADAEEYYLTLYQVKDGMTEYIQDFESFDSQDKVAAQGWTSTTYSTTTSAKKDGQMSLYLKNTGDSFTTETYQAAIGEVSYWVSTLSADVDTIGIIVLEASTDGNNFVEVQRTIVPARTKGKTYSVELSEQKNYRQFRLSYTDCGGRGLALDAFTAICTKKVEFVYTDRQCVIPGGNTSYTVAGLEPNTTYHYQLCCTDGDKGCVETITAPSAARQVTTLQGEAIDSQRLTIIEDKATYDERTFTIFLPKAEGYSLFIYAPDGQLIWSTEVTEGISYVTLPPQHFIKGRPYVAKYTATDKMSRKDKFVKFIF